MYIETRSTNEDSSTCSLTSTFNKLAKTFTQHPGVHAIRFCDAGEQAREKPSESDLYSGSHLGEPELRVTKDFFAALCAGFSVVGPGMVLRMWPMLLD